MLTIEFLGRMTYVVLRLPVGFGSRLFRGDCQEPVSDLLVTTLSRFQDSLVFLVFSRLKFSF